jgi:molybdenum cofactor cytidylyltransferase
MTDAAPLTGAEGVILAAGSSFRAGAFKPALDLGGRSMILRCLEGMLETCSRVIIVGGFSFDRLTALVRTLPGVECVQNPAYQQGMFTSVKAGLSRVRGEYCFLLPVDTPCVPARVYRSLAACGSQVAVPVYRGGRGHPVLLRSAIIPSILQEPDGSSLRSFIHRTGPAFVEVDAPEILYDVDTPDDYHRIVARFHDNR